MPSVRQQLCFKYFKLIPHFQFKSMMKKNWFNHSEACNDIMNWPPSHSFRHLNRQLNSVSCKNGIYRTEIGYHEMQSMNYMYIMNFFFIEFFIRLEILYLWWCHTWILPNNENIYIYIQYVNNNDDTMDIIIIVCTHMLCTWVHNCFVHTQRFRAT